RSRRAEGGPGLRGGAALGGRRGNRRRPAEHLKRERKHKMSPSVYAAFLAACVVIILVPGPTVTLIVANSIRHGTRAGLANVAGGQLGMAIVFAVVGIGLASVIEGMGHWFELVRLAGAAYLVWMGVQMFRSKGHLN